MDMKCTAHGFAMMSFSLPLLQGGQIGVTRSFKGELFNETWLKSALGLRSTNAIIFPFGKKCQYENFVLSCSGMEIHLSAS